MKIMRIIGLVVVVDSMSRRVFNLGFFAFLKSESFCCVRATSSVCVRSRPDDN